MTLDETDPLPEVLAACVVPDLVFAVQEGRAARVADLLVPLDWLQLRALAVVLASRVPRHRTRPDDGVIDEVAVERVVSGVEERALTTAEKEEAARRLAARDVPLREIARRLALSGLRLYQITGAEPGAEPPTEEGNAA